MLKTCMCNKSGCKTCDCSQYDKKQPETAKVLQSPPKEKFVDFNKLLDTENKQELVDILKKDVRTK